MDLKDSSQCTFYFVDSMTWPENLKAFLASSAGERPAFKEALQLMKKGGEYPFGEDFLQHRIRVLSLLLHPFLSTSSVRDYIASEGTPGIEDHCRSCHRLGDMVVCDVCGGTYHLTCLDPPLIDNPEEEDWTCLICRDDTLPGVLEGFTRSQEAARIRNEALGTDRAGNKYWFLCRRIFIEHNPHKNNKEAEGQEVSYFSFLSQFEEMMHALDPEVYETELCETLCNLRPEIERQMMLTEELTHELKDGSRSTYLELENELRENLNKDTSSTENNNDEAEVANLPKPENESELKEEDVKMEQSDEAVKDEIKEDKEGQKEPAEPRFIGRANGRRASYDKTNISPAQFWYALLQAGQEGSFRSYVNQYSTNPMALSKVQANEERDKKRYMSHKFSLTDASAFKWQGNLFGSRSLLISTVRQSLIHLESSIPNMFMHSNWSILRKPWIGAVNQSLSSRDFSRALTVLQCCMRPCVMLSVWSDMLGHTSLKRVASGTKEEKKRAEKREKKEIEEREERLRPYNNFVKYTLGVKHLIVKQKGEEYRSHGQHGWLWLSSHRVFKPSDARLLGLRAGPHRLAVKYTDTRDNSSKVVLMEPRGFEYLLKRQTELELKKKKNADEGDLSESSGKEAESSKIAVDTKKLEEALKNARLDRQVPPEDSLKDVVNVEQGLSNPTRALFPKVAKKASVIDDFLARRLQLKTIEEQSLSTETKKEEDELEDSEEEQDSRKIYLKRVKNSGSDRKSSKIVKYPLAPHFFSKTRKARSILILSRHDAKHMARKAGTATAEGFNYSSRINNSVWPYPCPRPTFRTAWLYRTASLSSLHGIALQMRILWGCIRWDDLFAKPPQSAEGKHQVTTDISVVTTEILKQRCRGRFLEKNEFLVKRVIIPLDTPKPSWKLCPSAQDCASEREPSRRSSLSLK
ncbi:Nucleosomeremodeling factor subunit NURF301like [Caligus rogercresseyi]|uniref:Nucleosomeremodeling factor subunit NURF301like n=1 Tax=Caligus rogercresseyi TaxID=217165 RepID=A0A7T8HLC0_CALRO|nr:Nucleosomeremodeling factor subunit NURF301like [Caligus rogercresseyi]